MAINKMRSIWIQWIALTGLSILAFIAFLDATIVITVLPAIQRYFNIGVIKLQWVNNAYLLTNCMFMIVAGKLGDLYGHRRIFYISITFFGLAALFAGLSSTINWVIFFRALQGAFSAGIFGVAVALISQIFPQQQQTKAIGIYSAITGLGLASGPFLGGLIITFFNWRWVFFLNIPIILLGWLLTAFSLQKSPRHHSEIKIDWAGLFLLISTIGSLVFALIHGGQIGWHHSVVWLLFLFSALTFTALVMVEKHTSQPLLYLEVFKQRSLIIAVLSIVGGGIVSGVFMLFNPLFLDTIRNYSPLLIGLMLAAMPIMQITFSSSITLITRIVTIEQTVVLALCSLFAACIMHYFMGMTSSALYIIIAYLLLGIPWGAANTCAVAIAHQHTKPQYIGSVIGTIFTTWNVCGSIMLAITVVIFHSWENKLMSRYLSQQSIALTAKQKEYIASVISNPDHASTAIRKFATGNLKGLYHAFQRAFIGGFHSAMIFTLVVTLALLATTFYLVFDKK